MKKIVRNIIARLFERQVVRLIRRHHLKVVAVAGSVGKTTTKIAIANVLSAKYRVLVHQGNYNSQLALPLSIFELEVPSNLLNLGAWMRLYLDARIRSRSYPYQVLVLELGTDHPGEIAAFSYLHPDISVITAVAPEHMEFFADLDAVADEEFSVATYSRRLVLNSAFDQLKVRAAGLTKVHWYHNEVDDFNITDQPLHLRQALSAGVVVGRLLRLSDDEITAGLKTFTPVSGRMVRLKGLNGSNLIDDSYNSSPIAVKAGLEALRHSAPSRKIAVLGQMNELGRQSAAYHREVGGYCTDLDLLITLAGDANTYLGPAAVKAGLAASHVKAFDSPYEAGKWLQDQLKTGDVVLIKGSQNGVFAEEVTKLLLADPADKARLVRQSDTWLKRKASQFGVQ